MRTRKIHSIDAVGHGTVSLKRKGASIISWFIESSLAWRASPNGDFMMIDGNGIDVVAAPGIWVCLGCEDSEEGDIVEQHDFRADTPTITAYPMSLGGTATVWMREGYYVPTTEHSDYLAGLHAAQDFIESAVRMDEAESNNENQQSRD
jgi:hypothetical protein